MSDAVSDNDSMRDDMSIGEIIASVDKCIDILTEIEQATVFSFVEPLPGSARATIWQMAGIEATCTLYQLPRLLERLQEAPRTQQWFVFLYWVLFGEEPTTSQDC